MKHRVILQVLAVSLGLAVLALCAGAAPSVHAAPALTRIIFASAAPSQNPLFENIEIGKELGYYRDAGIDIEFQYLGSNQAVMAALLSGRAQVGVCTQDFQIGFVAAGNELKTICFYEYSYPLKWDFAVAPDSPIRSVSDLNGRTVGLVGLGTADESIVKQWLETAGVNPSQVRFQVVGNGTPAGVALQQGRVDAMFAWDTTLGSWDVAGIKYRVLPRPRGLPSIGGFYLQAEKGYVREHRGLIIGFAQAVAKGTVFALTNPRAAAKVYIKMHPESVGLGIPYDKAIQDIMVTVAHRSPEWKPPAGAPFGQSNATEWQNAVKLQGVQAKVRDVTIFFTNEYILEINRLDIDAIQRQARSY